MQQVEEQLKDFLCLRVYLTAFSACRRLVASPVCQELVASAAAVSAEPAAVVAPVASASQAHLVADGSGALQYGPRAVLAQPAVAVVAAAVRLAGSRVHLSAFVLVEQAV